MLVVLLGPPGAGKGTQAKYLADSLSLIHIASGDLLRDHQSKGTDLGIEAKSYMETGALVPDDLVIRMVLDRISETDASKGAVLDGFPRTEIQAKTLDGHLGESGIDAVLLIQVPNDHLVERIANRRLCQTCQRPFAPWEAQNCGHEGLYQRDDDKSEAVINRLNVYESQTFPLIEYYQSKGKFMTIDGTKEISLVAKDLLNALREVSKL
jgi:adenylate kinase